MRKSYFCRKLETTMHFLPDSIKFCCSCAEGAGIKIDDFSNLDKQKIIEKRKEYISLLNKGFIPSECRGCVEYKEISLKERICSLFQKKTPPKISHIIIDHFKICSCSCVYCSQKKLYPDIKQNYELLPVIKDLYSSEMISDNLKAEFQGGDISMLKEFEALMKEFNAHNCDDFVILTNGIKYMPLLETIGSNDKSHICISLDSGTRETFAEIKSVDAFDTVIDNIKKLRRKSNAAVSLKYIIVQGMNDNIEELKHFLGTAENLGNINPVILEIDYNDTLLNRNKKFKIPEHYYEMFDYAEKFCRSRNINYTVYPYTKSLLEQNAGR